MGERPLRPVPIWSIAVELDQPAEQVGAAEQSLDNEVSNRHVGPASARPLVAQPHEYVRGGTCKILTLFQPTTGQVHPQPVSSCINVVLHGWLKERLEMILATLIAP